jgi:spore germination cell wall hydrolase CwlJ-like protein
MVFVICAISLYVNLDFSNKVHVYPVVFHEVVQIKPIHPPIDHQRPVQTLSKNDLSEYEQKELKCLAKNMYHEAGGEGYLGWFAVGMVTMNRVLSEKYPKSVCGVVHQNNGKSYQFSWAGTKKALTKPSEELYNRIEQLALLIYVRYEKLHDITEGALFFHANYVRPYWVNKMKKTVQIGNHIFYTL